MKRKQTFANPGELDESNASEASSADDFNAMLSFSRQVIESRCCGCQKELIRKSSDLVFLTKKWFAGEGKGFNQIM